MSLRVIVLGQTPSGLLQELSGLAASMSLKLIGPVTESGAAKAALSAQTSEAPDVVVLSAAEGGNGFELFEGLSHLKRPSSIIVVGGKDEDAVSAFQLQATDFILWPAPASRISEALVRARQQLLEVALLRTADEMQRLLGEIMASGGGELRSAIADRLATGPSSVGASSNGGSAARIREHAPQKGSSFRGSGTLVASAPERVAAARLRKSAAARSGERLDEQVLDLSNDGSGAAPTQAPLRVLVREGRRTRFVPLGDVDWFEADGNYIKVHSGSESHRTRGTIAAIEAALDPRQFVRIHRRIVVNMDRVREMTPLPGGDALLLLGDGSTLRLSRTYRTRVR